MIYMCLADGFEEVEALAPLDLLRRAGAEIFTVGIGKKTAVGSHGITVSCDLCTCEADPTLPDMLILPGGLPGTTNLDASDFVDKAIEAVLAKGGRLAAICAAPLILGKRGLLAGKHAVCYPGFEKELQGAIVSETAGVVTDGNITTAKGMGVAFEFGIELVRVLYGKEKADAIARATMRNFASTTYNNAVPEKIDQLIKSDADNDNKDNGIGKLLKDKNFLAAVEIAITDGKVATSLIQRKLAVGYGKAAMFLDAMEELAIISPVSGAKPRDVLISMDEWKKMLQNFKNN